MHIHYLQHIALETPGCILGWAAETGCRVTRTAFFAGEPLPDPTAPDLLLVMGGPMNIYEEKTYPWLKGEKACIRAAAAAGKTVVGLCLGAQLIADALGGRVTRGKMPEIGWHTVRWNEHAAIDPLFAPLGRETVVFQWHYDTFSTLPPGARLLAGSAACPHQAFAVGEQIFGFQFHLENTREMLEGYIAAGADEMVPGPATQTPEQVRARYGDYIPQANEMARSFFTALAQRAARR